MSRRRFGFATWTLREDLRDHLPMAVFEMQCRTCGAMSGGHDNTAILEQDWALSHTGRHPGHREFLMTARTYWCTEPGTENPFAEVTP